MSAEYNKATARRIYDEVINTGDLDRAEEFIARDLVEHAELPGTDVQGVEAFKQLLTIFRSAFPDLRFTVEQMVAEGDKVATRSLITGTHRGPFMGVEPTGKKIAVTSTDILRFEEGKVVEHWGEADMLSVMRELGVVPETAST